MTKFYDLPPLCCALFGAPGTGKTTTLRLLRDACQDPRSKFWFEVIDEPTNQPVIVHLLKQMYAETPESIERDGSIAFEVQCAILRARIKAYVEFTQYQLAGARATARSNQKRLVVVLDGHPITDELLYVAAKNASGQISDGQRDAYIGMREYELEDGGDLFRRPSLFCQIMIGNDPTGAEHHKRVCIQRQNAAEQGVGTHVFANLARFADDARMRLQKSCPLDDLVCEVDSQGCAPETVRDGVVEHIERYCSTVEFKHLPALTQ